MSPDIHKSSGNIFKDLGRSDADELKLRAQLLSQILDTIEAQGLIQKDVATILNIKQSEVSNLMRGKLSRFSRERLVNYLVSLGSDVEIVVKKPRRRARTQIQRPGSLRLVTQLA